MRKSSSALTLSMFHITNLGLKMKMEPMKQQQYNMRVVQMKKKTMFLGLKIRKNNVKISL